jgi:MPBQ/MSBQ methyltransferase
MDKVPKEIDISDLGCSYDEIIFNPAICGYMGEFLNYGYWDENTPDQKIACGNLMEKLLALIPDKTGNILDVACGKGGTTRHLLKYYQPQNVTGINISERQLEAAQANAPGCTFLLMNATDLAFPDASFNNIICVEAAFHFDTRKRFFQEAYRVLKPGGTLVLSDILMTMAAERRRKFRTEKNYVRDPEHYKKVLQRVRFGEVEVVDCTELCWVGYFWNVVNYCHDKYFAQEIDLNFLHAILDRTYQVGQDIEYYLLAAARKD